MGEDDQEVKHKCKFCYKIFPCGRSLGGHMRSHLINILSDHQKTNEKLPKKRLPPLTNAEIDVFSVKGGAQFKENPNRASKLSKKPVEDTLLLDKLCKECGKSFHSWKALFGHMKCHSAQEDSWNSSSDHQKLIMDSQSDNEAAMPSCRRKRSNRMKRCTIPSNSSCLTIAKFSPSVSEIDQQEQEEVALSLILLSQDMDSVVESIGTTWEFLEPKILNSEELKPEVKQSQLRSPAEEFGADNKNLDIGWNESEVNSPKNLIKISPDHFGSDTAKKKSCKRKCHTDSASKKKCKFMCIICRKFFPSYQALGGHRASQKKFKGCCAPKSDQTTIDIENSRNRSDSLSGVFAEKKDHECPICFKIFPSGQALGGHKRSHVIGDHRAKRPSVSIVPKTIPEIRNFLDLNLPAPVEEDCISEMKPWWIGTNQEHEHKPSLLGLLSS